MERLKTLIESRKVTPYQVCRDTGVSEAALSRILSGKTKKINNKTAEALAAYFHVDKMWLMNDVPDSTMINNDSGVIVNGHNTVGNIDNRHYTSDSPDVLRQDIARLEMRAARLEALISEKDTRIEEQKALINQLLEVISKK